MADPYRFGGPIPESVQRMKERRAKRAENAYWLEVEGRRLIADREERRSPSGDSPAISRSTPCGSCAAGSPAIQVVGRFGPELQQSGQPRPSMRRSP